MEEDEERSFNEYLKKYEWKIDVTAKKFLTISSSCHTVDFMMDLEDLKQEGTIILFKCWKLYRHLSSDNFNRLFQYSIERGILKHAKQRKNFNIYIDLTTDYHRDPKSVSYDGSRGNHSQLQSSSDQLRNGLFVSPFKQYEKELKYNLFIQKVLMKIKSKIAKAVLYELVNPSPKTFYNAILDEKRKKMMKKQHKSNYIPKKISLQHQYIYHSLDITKQQFDYALKEIKKAAKKVYDQEQQIEQKKETVYQ